MQNTRFCTIGAAILCVAATTLLGGCGDDLPSPILPEEEVEQPTVPPVVDPIGDDQTYTMEGLAPFPILNAVTNNPFEPFADERDFLRIMNYGTTGVEWNNPLNEMDLEVGGQYVLFAHVHNDANKELGDDGVAKNVSFTLSYPTVVNGDANISIVVTADNTLPQTIGDGVTVHSDEEFLITFADSKGPYPVKVYDYALKNPAEIEVTYATVANTGIISGQIGDLNPGYTTDSGAYVYLWFSVEKAPAAE